MKALFAYFTDVHGNSDALQAVIDDATGRGISRFISGGDMIGIGPFTNEVLERLFNLPSIMMVTGNHDEAVLALKYGLSHPKSHSHAKQHHQWIADQLKDAYAHTLSTLPRELTFEEDGFRFLITHYPFKEGKKESSISEDPFMPIISEPDSIAMKELFKESLVNDFIGFGHHHIVHDYKINQTHLVNPGALGCNKVAEARYAIVYKTDEQELSIDYKSVPYDQTRLFKAYNELEVPDGPFLMKAFHS
ncbi:metallophosphoesterase family protein [Fictibacillus nanhaiensis]|uniref:Metallophosphoesterase family protein n=1 Tax=Fictibacillus nanhaiensis TaxID=742169 RepID=A0ABS2ZIU8_9BACL|nr:metallophosphoesterase family protein [Fictibacillus nanhaiensis]